MLSLVELMMDKGLISRKDYEKLSSAGMQDEPFHRLALRTGLIAEDDYLDLLEEAYGYQVVHSLPEGFNPEQFGHVSVQFMQEHLFVPLELTKDEFRVVVSDPLDFLLLDSLKKMNPDRRMVVCLARRENIQGWLQEHFQGKTPGFTEEGDNEEAQTDASTDVSYLSEDLEQLRDLASEAPVIKRVNRIMTGAVEKKASDIHLEPFEGRIQVRYRIDGILQKFMEMPGHMHQALATRIKIMAGLDIAERRVPQDGRIRSRIAGKDIDIRVSCLPTVYGESVVMRILDRSSASFTLEQLGFPGREYQLFQELIHSPHGIILVTGPTGSGKTTTLYAALNAINSIQKKIITVEDPVEYELEGINQVHVNPRYGLSFADGLRSIVRQDPDVILIGEIRDRETADIAIQSALTGHLVFSTLHTNDAAGAVARLMEIGVEDYLLASSIIGIMAQRLVRILCPECRQTFSPEARILKKYDLAADNDLPQELYQPAGCPACSYTGYSGRTAIFELLGITEEIRELIIGNKSAAQIRNAGVKQGMTLLRRDGWNKVKQGVTSLEEVLRVTGQ